MRISLLVGGLNSCLMGSYHFLIPFAWHWGLSLSRLPPTLRWSSYSINFFLSYLMVGGGVLTLIARHRVRSSQSPDLGAIAMMAGFWLVNTVYQILIPIPLPTRLSLLRLLLMGFGAGTAVAYGIAFRAGWMRQHIERALRTRNPPTSFATSAGDAEVIWRGRVNNVQLEQ